MMKKVAIIGAGFSGLSAAAYTAKAGHEVHVFEKHDRPGGRARQFSTAQGFVFDMGPSWYWMPDVMEDFFTDFDYKTTDFFELISLNPQFEIIFEQQKIDVPHNYEALKQCFEQIEKGAATQLEKFMQAAKYKYQVGMKEFVTKPSHSWLEFASPKIAKSALKLDLLTNFRAYVQKYFKDDKLRTLMEFPVIFLGASPKNIPAMYSLMNYGGYAMGTYYPIGGFYQLVLAMKKVAEKQGATFHFNQQVDQIIVKNKNVKSLVINGKKIDFDVCIASSDYHHSEQLLDEKYRNYSEKYWETRIFAPSSLIFYLGIDQKIPRLKHHTLFFENNLDEHIDCIYENKKWPEKPLFYSCCPSKTDEHVAPKGKENLFLLMPLANREKYEQLKPYAKKLGSAFQKINFLRDLKDDYQELGRTYFPNVDMKVFNNQVKDQIEKEIAKEFKEALIGIKMLPNSAKFGIYLAYKYYVSLFKKIRRKSSSDILLHRIRVSNPQKAFVAFKSYVRYKAAIL